MIKVKYLLAGLAACFTALPSYARVDPGTADLLSLVESYGVDVRINTRLCDGSKHGSFGITRSGPVMSLCTEGAVPNAEDHNTVRHEVWHFIQWCRTPVSSTTLTPLLKDKEKYAEFISFALSRPTVERIRAHYRDDHELVELEAFAAAELFNAQFISEQVVTHCGA